MTSVQDVLAHPLIEKIANDLKENKKLKAPEFTLFIKTGSHRQRAPDNPDWWFIRMGSILRKVYVSGPVTVKSLRSYYGGKKERGVRPSKFRRSGGKIIRVCLQELGKLGYIKISDDKKGRVITPQGQKYLDSLAGIVFKEHSSKKETIVPKIEIKIKKEVSKTDVNKEETRKEETKVDKENNDKLKKVDSEKKN
ncbi:MAG: 30S ribosomal protein S19e [archaeon]|nr:30S ribosomal protein S19e [Candidatus ainarchaeum sp.]MDD3084959.1 30S ribosomal protein S19e [Candidatus ainarchaeum sp.]MDD4221405.1 30S ribosomal protein S19e [Candidatus ainarchaeum sp.]MDD4662955.1 30S ribosomal protein S19e [Candidatus ainarchaeum sp.]